MPNRRYRSGVYYERLAKAELEESGYVCIRSAGSKGEFGLIAMKPGEPVRCIQIKSSRSERGVNQLLAKFNPTIEPSPTAYQLEIWIRHRGKWFTKTSQP